MKLPPLQVALVSSGLAGTFDFDATFGFEGSRGFADAFVFAVSLGLAGSFGLVGSFDLAASLGDLISLLTSFADSIQNTQLSSCNYKVKFI